jgi:hypothetical protein
MKAKHIVAVVMMGLSSAAMAAKPGTEEPSQATGYLGQTSSTFAGDTNMAGLYAACQLEYEGARVCNTKELFESPSIAGETVPADGMWARPYIVSMSPKMSGQNSVSTLYALDYSGAYVNAAKLPTCTSANTSLDGNYVSAQWQFLTNGLCSTARPAACCR